MIDRRTTGKIKQFFDRDAQGFDQIYTGKTNKLTRWLNARFRKGIYMRHEETVMTCGDVTGIRILDIGCGSGRIATDLALRGAKVVGIDISDEMLRIAQKVAAQKGVADHCKFIREDFFKYKPDRPFDILIALGFFDYIPDAYPFLQRMHECTSKMVIATFPKRGTPRSFARKIRLALLRCPVYFYTQPQIYDLYERAGFVLERVEKQANAYFTVAQINA